MVRERRTACRMAANRQTEGGSRVEDPSQRQMVPDAPGMRHEPLGLEGLDGAPVLQGGDARHRFAAGRLGMASRSMRMRDSITVAFVIVRHDRMHHTVMMLVRRMGCRRVRHEMASAMTARGGHGGRDNERDQRNHETPSPVHGSALSEGVGPRQRFFVGPHCWIPEATAGP